MATTYGYARVSSADQNESRQIVALKDAGVDEANIFVDRRSGKDFNRPRWRRMRRVLRAGDLLVVQSLDRLGRNYAEMLEEWRFLVRRKRIDIRVLDMPVLDTTNRADGLVGSLIADIVLQLLAFVAENERRNIRERQRQGIAAAHARGVRFGRPAWQPTDEFLEIAASVRRGEMPANVAAEKVGLCESTFRYRLKSCRTLLQ